MLKLPKIMHNLAIFNELEQPSSTLHVSAKMESFSNCKKMKLCVMNVVLVMG